MSRGNRIDVSDVNAHQALAASEASGNIADWTKGSNEPKVVIVEFADFQCPGCRNAFPVLNDVMSRYGEHVQLIYRHFPLSSIHPNARAAAAAAEAAGKQGKFWDMHSKLFESQNEWAQANGTTRTDLFANYASALSIDREKFIEDITSSDISSKINFDIALGRDLGVDSTPTLYVDGKLLDEWYKDEQLVPQNTEGAAQVWTNSAALGKLIIEPKLRDAGVDLSKLETIE